jgi:hypothetical protein
VSTLLTLAVYQNNDDLWEAIRPALLLVSKVLEGRPEYLNAVCRVWEHKRVPIARDPRTARNRPLLAFDTVPPASTDPGLFAELQFIRNFPETFVNAVWEVVARDVRWSILGNLHPCAITTNWPDQVNNLNARPLHYIILNADSIYPLVVSEYTSSERIISSFHLAAIMLHELAVSEIQLRPCLGRGPSPQSGTV